MSKGVGRGGRGRGFVVGVWRGGDFLDGGREDVGG